MSHTCETQRLHTDTILSTSEPEENRRDAWCPSDRCSPIRRKPVCGALSTSPGTVAAWEQPQRHEGSGTTFPPRWQGSASGRPLGRRTGCPWSLPCLLLWTPGPALSGERTHVCESGLSGSMGEAGKTGHVCARPCGPHLRASGKRREGVTPRTPAP